MDDDATTAASTTAAAAAATSISIPASAAGHTGASVSNSISEHQQSFEPEFGGQHVKSSVAAAATTSASIVSRDTASILQFV